MKEIKEWAENIVANIEKVFFGKHMVIEKLLAALLCRGHVLLEDVPGVGKTILARAVSASLGGEFARIQCTPDLLPADIIGVSVYNPQTGEFTFRQGPLHSNILLVDEINRATPRTQSALLEAMGENQVSIEGSSRPLPEPFFLLATENPVEFEGTFPLPEAQKDRFLLSLKIGYPSREVEKAVLNSQRRLTHPVTDIREVSTLEHLLRFQEKVVTVHVEEKVTDYILEIIENTRKSKYFQLGASPRGSLALYKCSQAMAALRGRDYVTPDDIKAMVIPVLCKRVIIKSEYLFKGQTPESVLEELLQELPVPVLGEHL